MRTRPTSYPVRPQASPGGGHWCEYVAITLDGRRAVLLGADPHSFPGRVDPNPARPGNRAAVDRSAGRVVSDDPSSALPQVGDLVQDPSGRERVVTDVRAGRWVPCRFNSSCEEPPVKDLDTLIIFAWRGEWSS